MKLSLEVLGSGGGTWSKGNSYRTTYSLVLCSHLSQSIQHHIHHRGHYLAKGIIPNTTDHSCYHLELILEENTKYYQWLRYFAPSFSFFIHTPMKSEVTPTLSVTCAPRVILDFPQNLGGGFSVGVVITGLEVSEAVSEYHLVSNYTCFRLVLVFTVPVTTSAHSCKSSTTRFSYRI